MYIISHYYEGGTKDQYDAVLRAVHPGDGLPQGQLHHFAASTGDGFLVVAVWDSKESNDTFIQDTLMPALPTVQGGFANPPQERSGEILNLVNA